MLILHEADFTFYQSRLLIDEFDHKPFPEKLANVLVNGILPPIVNPAAIPIMFASAIPIWKTLRVIFLEIIKF
jgi:hypothetical protein